MPRKFLPFSISLLSVLTVLAVTPNAAFADFDNHIDGGFGDFHPPWGGGDGWGFGSGAIGPTTTNIVPYTSGVDPNFVGTGVPLILNDFGNAPTTGSTSGTGSSGGSTSSGSSSSGSTAAAPPSSTGTSSSGYSTSYSPSSSGYSTSYPSGSSTSSSSGSTPSTGSGTSSSGYSTSFSPTTSGYSQSFTDHPSSTGTSTSSGTGTPTTSSGTPTTSSSSSPSGYSTSFSPTSSGYSTSFPAGSATTSAVPPISTAPPLQTGTSVNVPISGSGSAPLPNMSAGTDVTTVTPSNNTLAGGALPMTPAAGGYSRCFGHSWSGYSNRYQTTSTGGTQGMPSGATSSTGPIGPTTIPYAQLVRMDDAVYDQIARIQARLAAGHLRHWQRELLQQRLALLQQRQQNLNSLINNDLAARQARLQGIQSATQTDLTQVQAEQQALSGTGNPFATPTTWGSPTSANYGMASADGTVYSQIQSVKAQLAQPNLPQWQQTYLQNKLTALQTAQTDLNSALNTNLSAQQTALQSANTWASNGLTKITNQQTALTNTTGPDPFDVPGLFRPATPAPTTAQVNSQLAASGESGF